MDIQQTARDLVAAGFTQKAVADFVGCRQPTISDLIRGVTGMKRPSWHIVQGLSEMKRRFDQGELVPVGKVVPGEVA